MRDIDRRHILRRCRAATAGKPLGCTMHRPEARIHSADAGATGRHRMLPLPVSPFGYYDARPLLQTSASVIVAARDAQAGTPALLKIALPSAGVAFAQEHELLRSLAVPGLA